MIAAAARAVFVVIALLISFAIFKGAVDIITFLIWGTR